MFILFSLLNGVKLHADYNFRRFNCQVANKFIHLMKVQSLAPYNPDSTLE